MINGHAHVPALLNRRAFKKDPPVAKPLSKLQRLYAAFSEPVPAAYLEKRQPADAAAVEKFAQRLVDFAIEQTGIAQRIEELQDHRPPAQILPYGKVKS
jgi:hypothetical protein